MSEASKPHSEFELVRRSLRWSGSVHNKDGLAALARIEEQYAAADQERDDLARLLDEAIDREKGLEEQLEAAQLPEELTCGSCGLRIRGSAVIYCPRDHCPTASNPASEPRHHPQPPKVYESDYFFGSWKQRRRDKKASNQDRSNE